MPQPTKDYRLDGIYRQRQEGYFMQRVKLAAGTLSADQARTVAAVATRYGKGEIHLTTRGSMEIHWLQESQLHEVKRELATVGLTSRGACGGAVRGITCSSQGASGFPALETLARRIHRLFTGNPHFEQLPKKFKIGIEADTSGRRHLIQDVGIVFAGSGDGIPHYDIYLAGGLGREPQAGFLFQNKVPEHQIIPLIEAVAKVYRAHTPAGKRLKHLVRNIGQENFRRLLSREPAISEKLAPPSGLPDSMVKAAAGNRVEIRFFAGHLSAENLRILADFAATDADGMLMVTANQNIALHLSGHKPRKEYLRRLQEAGFQFADQTLRVCPGSDLCRMGLSPTREVAASLLDAMGPEAKKLSWALSGCPNSCTQPQLADIGIITTVLVKDDSGERSPRYDICRLGPQGLGTVTEQSLTADELYKLVRGIG